MTALMEVTLAYGAKAKFDELSAPQQETVKKALPQFFEKSNGELETYNSKIIDSRDAELLTKHDLSFEVKQFKGLLPTDIPEGVGSVHIHLPNCVLLSISQVTWLEDACTESLQSMLDEGWRILAICPPKNARRPDYILGREKGKE